MHKDIISAKAIEAALKSYNVSAKVYPTLVSTNQTAKEQAANGADEGSLIIAERQTGGRGRLGRSFFSPDESGVYFSLILRPNLKPEDTLLITTAAAVAVCKAIKAVSGKDAAIKWVNDIFLGGKKVCGILSEAAFDGAAQLNYVVLGIGINLYPPSGGFPKDIADTAGSVFDSPDKDIKNQLIIEAIRNFFEIYENIKSLNFIPEYQRRMLLIGKTVTFSQNGVLKTARVLGIDNACRLRVELPSGDITVLSAGEVTIGSNNIGK